MSNPAAWHPDPMARHEYRYWDGNAWTEHVSNGGVAGTDALTQAAPGAASSAIPVQQQAVQQPAVQQQVQQYQPVQQQPVQQTWDPQAAAQQPAVKQSNGLAITALILGLLSLLIAWIPFIGLMGVFGGFLAIVFGFIGRSKAKKVGSGKGAALTGLITGFLALLLGIVSTVLPILVLQGFVGDVEIIDACIRETGDEQACIEEFGPGWLQFFDGLDLE